MNLGRIAASTFLAALLAATAAPSAQAVLLNTSNFNGSGEYGGTITTGDVKFDIYCGSSAGVCANVDINTSGSTSAAATVNLTGAGGTALSGSANSYQDVTFVFAAYTVSGIAKITSLISSWSETGGGSAVLNGTIGSAKTGSSPGSNALAVVSLSAGTQTQTDTFIAQSVVGNCSTCSPFDAHAVGGTTLNSVSFTVGVPEPGTLALLFAGLTGIAATRRRRAA